MVAIDLGAESCRVSLLTTVSDKSLLQVVHRSPNRPLTTPQGLMWDFEAMFREIMLGLERCAALAPEGIVSIGVDGWAVDYVRLPTDGSLPAMPFCYRDERSVSSMAKLHALISPQRLYELTGGQIQRFNTLYQLYADHLRGVPASQLWLNLPEYLLYRLGARPVSEYTNSTHTQMLDVHSRQWNPEILAAAGLPVSGSPEVVQPGTDIGQLTGRLAQLPAYRNTRLIAPACHDTASAVAGIPATGEDWAFLSSGTWSLLGTVVQRSFTGEEPRAKNYTNQGGIGNAIYFLKNVNGMWMLRQSMDHWEQQGKEWSVQDLTAASASLPAPKDLLDVDDPDLLLPGKMPLRINAQLRRNGHAALEDTPEQAPHFANLIFHSLAARYAQVLEDLSTITGKKFRRLFVVGGGARNLNMKRLVEQSTGLEIVLGSAESSTLGNFAIQLAAAEVGPGCSGVSAASVARWAATLAETPLQ